MWQLFRLLEAVRGRVSSLLQRVTGWTDTPRDPAPDRGVPGWLYVDFIPEPEPAAVVVIEFEPDPAELMPRPSLEGIEYGCRVLMAHVVGMQERGFDSTKAKARKRAELDDALDLYNALAGLVDTEETP